MTLKWDSESLKVIESGTVQQSTYAFIFVFHSKYAASSRFVTVLAPIINQFLIGN